MLLRTRISIFVILTFAIVCASILFASSKREELTEVQFSNEKIFDQLNLWKKVKSELTDRLKDTAWVATQHELFAEAMVERNTVDLRVYGTEIASGLVSQGAGDRFDAIYPDGTLAYSSHASVFQSPIISGIAQEAVESGAEMAGVGNDRQRNTALVYAFPLRVDGQVVGLGALATDIVEAILEMEKLTSSSVMIVNRRGRLLVATEDNTWKELGQFVRVNELNAHQVIEQDERFYSAAVLPQVAELGGLVGRLIIIKDVTDLTAQQRRIGQITIVAIGIFLVFVLVALNFYMSKAFSPLAEGVQVLEALSHGNLHVQIDHRYSQDEVGKIVEAVDTFRTSLLTLTRLRRSRDRQRARQERFIQREMTQLADTLDGEERKAVLEELEELDEIVQTQVEEQDDSKYTSPESMQQGARRDSGALAMMATAFHSMSNRVQDQHQRLRDALATKEALIALRQELDIATRVQLSLVPKEQIKDDVFVVSGVMHAAKEVGGDFFDYFRLDEHRVGIAIADVSGKGVAAALFMAMGRTLLRGMVIHVESPAKVLREMNDFLEQNNDEQLFVTMLYGVFDERSGQFTYASAGHDPPVLYTRSGEVRTLETTNNFVLAMFPDQEYDEISVSLESGARLLMHTDGITEATDLEEEQFGVERLKDAITSLPDQEAHQDVVTIVEKVNDFAGDAPQFDDITCVVLHYIGADVVKESADVSSADGEPDSDSIQEDTDVMADNSELSVTIRNDLSELGRLAELVERHGEERDWPMEWILNSNLSLDELITNIINYGFADGREKTDIRLVMTEDGGRLKVILEDDGIAFNPFVEADPPDLEAPIDDRPIGGLGVHFVKTLFTEYCYERVDNVNRITLYHDRPE